jgi:hypothetical protein
MNELSGNLSVKNLENVTGKDEALESNLDQKIHIGSLKLVWSDDVNVDGSLQLEILEGLKPPSKLKSLEIKGFESAKYPSWLLEGSHFENLESFKLVNCSALEDLPLSTKLFKYCSELLLKNVSTLRTLSCLPAALTGLCIASCPLLMFVTNDELEPQDQREDIMRTQLASQLASLWEVDSGNDIREVILSEHSSLKQLLTLMDADISHLQTIASVVDRENDVAMMKEDIIKAWICCHQKRIQFIYGRNIGMPLVPPSGLRRLDLFSCSITDGALAVCLGGLTSLKNLSLVEVMTFTTLPSQDVLQHLTKLDFLFIKSCWCLRSLGGLRAATSLSEVRLISCPSLDLAHGADLMPLSLETLCLHGCVVAANLCSSDLPHLTRLSMFGCRSPASLSIGHLTCLRSLSVGGFPDLCFFEGFSCLKLQSLHLTDVPKLTAECIAQFRIQHSLTVSSPEMLNHMLSSEGFTFPPYLSLESCKDTSISFEESPNFTSVKWLRLCVCEMNSLPGNLKCLSSLTNLEIFDCPNISSLPDLPPSLQHLGIRGCETLQESCRAPDGESWPKIAHIRWKDFR